MLLRKGDLNIMYTKDFSTSEKAKETIKKDNEEKRRVRNLYINEKLRKEKIKKAKLEKTLKTFALVGLMGILAVGNGYFLERINYNSNVDQLIESTDFVEQISFLETTISQKKELFVHQIDPGKIIELESQLSEIKNLVVEGEDNFKIEEAVKQALIFANNNFDAKMKPLENSSTKTHG